MCEPTTIMAIGAIATTLVTGYVTSENQKAQGEYNAEVAEQNAGLARARADDANAMGTREQEQAAWRIRMQSGQQRAAIAANNVDPTMGTPADILGETALFGEIDQQNIRLNAMRQAWGHQADATNLTNEAGMSRWQGKTQSQMTILGSLGQAATIGAGAYGGGRAAAGRAAARQGGNAVNMSGGYRGLSGWGY